MIVQTARSWIGVPFRHQGRDRRGVDCAGLVICTGIQAGVLKPLPRESLRYGPKPLPSTIRRLLDQFTVQSDTLDPGCIVWFGHPRVPTHLGIWTGEGVIDSDGTIGRVSEHPLVDPIHAVYRFPGLNDGA